MEITVITIVEGREALRLTLQGKTPGQVSRLQRSVQECVDAVRAEMGPQ